MSSVTRYVSAMFCLVFGSDCINITLSTKDTRSVIKFEKDFKFQSTACKIRWTINVYLFIWDNEIMLLKANIYKQTCISITFVFSVCVSVFGVHVRCPTVQTLGLYSLGSLVTAGELRKTHMTPEKWQRCQKEGLCIYCGGSGYFL